MKIGHNSLTHSYAIRKSTVWCRGGSRYVEGCWGFPYLRIQKLPSCHFMFLIYIKCVSNILQICAQRSSSFSSARLRLFNFSKFPNFKIFKVSKYKVPTFRNAQKQSFGNSYFRKCEFPNFTITNFKVSKGHEYQTSIFKMSK